MNEKKPLCNIQWKSVWKKWTKYAQEKCFSCSLLQRHHIIIIISRAYLVIWEFIGHFITLHCKQRNTYDQNDMHNITKDHFILLMWLFDLEYRGLSSLPARVAVVFTAVMTDYAVAITAYFHKYNCAHCNEAESETKVKTSVRISEFSMVYLLYIDYKPAWITSLQD